MRFTVSTSSVTVEAETAYEAAVIAQHDDPHNTFQVGPVGEPSNVLVDIANEAVYHIVDLEGDYVITGHGGTSILEGLNEIGRSTS